MVIDPVVTYFRNYFSRHRNPWSRAFHLVGVPLAPFGCTYLLLRGRFTLAAAAFTAGYGLQWLGHTIEGNEVGEYTTLKGLAMRFFGRNADEHVGSGLGDGSDRLPGGSPG